MTASGKELHEGTAMNPRTAAFWDAHLGATAGDRGRRSRPMRGRVGDGGDEFDRQVKGLVDARSAISRFLAAL
ncbi:hypothetical protein ACFRAQ_36475 [Nocardia sp. NPDC056611]|uniref:hypothetical protein n=1 Tax=Nocardia sp. NPDC056611 TaxID=3345877 RepID=UPI003671F67D